MAIAKIVKIGGVSIGLAGLDAAIAKVRGSDPHGVKGPEDAALEVLSILEEKNYIPAAARDAYINAIKRLWTGAGGGDDPQDISIRILGPGCVSCNRLEEIVRSVLEQKGIAADIEHVKDLDEIWRYGVINTPALVINERVLCSGRLPTRFNVEQWLQEIAAKLNST
jgi:small redox-active disulfide protein 2